MTLPEKTGGSVHKLPLYSFGNAQGDPELVKIVIGIR